MRIPRIDIESGDETVQTFAQRVTASRKADIVSGHVPNLFAVLLHRPNIAEAFFNLATQLRQHNILPDRTRELVIMHVALLTRTAHLWDAHMPHCIKAGLSEAALFGMATDRTPFDARDRATLAYAEEMTVNIDVSDVTADELARHFSQAEIVELTALVALYNLTNRMIHAFAIDEDGRPETRRPFIDPLTNKAR